MKTIDFGSVKLRFLALHEVGNKIQEEDLNLSDFEIKVEENSVLHKSLMTYFLKSFKEVGYHHFTDGECNDLTLNEVFGFSKRLFENTSNENFMVQSREIAKHLYNSSTHPNIKKGDLYVVYLEDCIIDGDVVNAIGLFKTEKKEKFLKVDELHITQSEGALIKRLDKGCLIFDVEESKGFKVLLKENKAQNVEAQYWKESFLKLKRREDTFFHTENYLNLCRDFVEEVFNEKSNVDRPVQLEMLDRMITFFTENEQFNIVAFENAVLENPEVIEAFQNYTEDFKETYALPIYSEFNINASAVKQLRKNFKAVIKLDQKIQLNISGHQDRIERGFDDAKGMSYYTVYYHEEV